MTGTDKFGWCLPGVDQHEKCITISISNRRCECSCHKGEETP